MCVCKRRLSFLHRADGLDGFFQLLVVHILTTTKTTRTTQKKPSDIIRSYELDINNDSFNNLVLSTTVLESRPATIQKRKPIPSHHAAVGVFQLRVPRQASQRFLILCVDDLADATVQGILGVRVAWLTLVGHV